MTLPRRSGVLLHITSLPGRYGIGDLGSEARGFVDWLVEAGQGLWQILPLQPPGYGNSPYSSLSSFAWNPLLISPERLVQDGYLEARELAAVPAFPPERVQAHWLEDYALFVALKEAHLGREWTAWTTFRPTGSPTRRRAMRCATRARRPRSCTGA
jgi:4-alpha-glucanotransferase